MSRYTGSINKKSRRLEFSLLENDKEFSKGKKRHTPPGQHGHNKVKISAYGEQLREKQKIALMYGLNDKQMYRFIELAKLLKDDEGVSIQNDLAFLFLLESRLDNLIFRMGFAPTRRMARQVVNHGHVLVNGKNVNIPSYIVKIGDKIELAPSMTGNNTINAYLNDVAVIPNFVNVDKASYSGTYLRYPERKELNGEIIESKVIEYYNK
ncbi:MAG: 30S ribosomal protein S4 [Mycoplasmataceae bacterium]|jgi:small subunit ribosomal protein S4|nr:30S ribosomal protein S4 [Mycoplasmataceae bacterium]